ncbi:hypothetical protein CHH67_20355 [Paenibacillus campinasensis]|uniref:Apea-like HEPN domain-containing protein n=1 Tax=Paenibacillus campinasensis TaxID=66347 RepID=A0A268EJJ6_9BACL|nr:hypothetical protein CHH67_20355 [Paenibacillus campinasensis]
MRLNLTNNVWWFFFPLKGLLLKDTINSISNPIFHDATIISREQIEGILPILDSSNSTKNDSNNIIYLFEDDFYDDFDVYLAIKRTGIIPIPDGSKPELLKKATARAYEIAALLTIVYFEWNGHKGTCGLLEQMHRYNKTIMAYNFESKGFNIHLSDPITNIIETPEDYLEFTHSEITDLLNSERYVELSTIIINYRYISSQLRSTVILSVLRLSSAIHSLDYSSQILGCVTAIEILFSEQGDGFGLIKKRVRALVGQMYDSLSVEEVFNARHLFVHKGTSIDDQSIALKAIKLAIEVLIYYSKSTQKGITSKKQMSEYLDVIYTANKYALNWNHNLLEN